MSNYTPEADEVHDVWLNGGDDATSVRLERSAEFDRWLDSERARAWDEGMRVGALSQKTFMGRRVSYEVPENPYRSAS